MASQVEGIKWVPGTQFMVDGFAFTNPKCSHYFLTHCHSDHTIGLVRRFTAGTIYCSPVTAALLAAEWNLHAPTVQQLQLNQPTVIDAVTVTALDANHCPGAVMLLFEVPAGHGQVTRILHTGDCRWQDRLYSSTCLARKRIDTLMLDTTYALPKHTFPPQAEAVNMMVQLMSEALHEEPDTLMVVSSYHIGKERAYLGAAAALGLKVFVPAAKLRVLQLLDLPQQLMSVLTTTDPSAQLHVGCTSLAPDELQAYLAKQQQQGARAWVRIMGFRATGWSYRRSGGLHVQRPTQTVALVGIPYSEHSSWLELRQCVERLRPKRLIPTVNAATRSQQQALVDRFADLMDLSRDRGRMDFYLLSAAPAAAAECQQLSTLGAAGPAGVAAKQAAAPAAAGVAAPQLYQQAAAQASAGVDAAPQAAVPAASGVAASHVAASSSSGVVSPSACAPVTPCARASETARAADPVAAAATAAEPADAETDLRGAICTAASGEAVCSTSAGVIGSAMGQCLPSQPVPLLLPPQQQPEQLWEGVGSGEGVASFDLSSVDMQEQQRLLADAERRQRLKKSLQAAHGRAAAQKQRGRSRVPAASQGVGKRRASILNKGAHSR